jgi:hypothetical protein
MSFEDAAHLVTVQRAERDIINDPSMDLQTKVRAMGTIQNAAALKPADHSWLTLGEITQGAIGAGLGYGAGHVLGKLLGASPDTLSTMRTLGMGFGTLLNMGKIAMDHAVVEQDRRNAIRYAFVKQAMDLGLFELLQLPVYKKIAGANFVTALPLGPDLVTAPINAGISVGSNLASNAGALAGSLSAPDATDERMTKMLLARRALEGQADELIANRHQAILKKILDKRVNR